MPQPVTPLMKGLLPLTHEPLPHSLHAYRNGVAQEWRRDPKTGGLFIGGGLITGDRLEARYAHINEEPIPEEPVGWLYDTFSVERAFTASTTAPEQGSGLSWLAGSNSGPGNALGVGWGVRSFHYRPSGDYGYLRGQVNGTRQYVASEVKFWEDQFQGTSNYSHYVQLHVVPQPTTPAEGTRYYYEVQFSNTTLTISKPRFTYNTFNIGQQIVVSDFTPLSMTIANYNGGSGGQRTQFHVAHYGGGLIHCEAFGIAETGSSAFHGAYTWQDPNPGEYLMDGGYAGPQYINPYQNLNWLYLAGWD